MAKKLRFRVDVPTPKMEPTDDQDAMAEAADADMASLMETADDADGPAVTQDGPSSGPIALSSVLDMEASSELKAAVLAADLSGGRLALAAGDVERMSTSGVQTLIAVQKYAAQHKADAVLLKPSAAVVDAFDDLGLFSSLMGWKVET